MFREFKEYQDIANLYQNKIYQTDEQIITESFESEKFTEEEAAFIEENFDALIEEVIAEEESLSEQITGRQRGKALRQKANEIISDIRKPAAKTTKVSSKAIQGGGAGAFGKFKSALGKVGSKIGQFGKNVAKTATMQGSSAAKGSKFAARGAKVLSKLGPAGKAAAVATLAGGAIAAGLASRAKKNKAAKDAAIEKQVDDYVAKRKKPVVPGTRVREIGAEGGGKPSEGDFKKDFPDKKPEVKKPQTEIDKIAATPSSQIKKTGRTAMIKKNIDRFGKERVQKLQDKQKDFKLMRSKKMSKDDFIKKYPKSITAQRAKGLRDQTEWDAYDLVLEYLHSSGQIATIEEANYVMTEMDAETIQGIVEEQKKNLEEGLASMALKTGLVVGGAALAKKGLDKAKKSFDNYLNKQRDKGIGGNTRPGSDKIYYGK